MSFGAIASLFTQRFSPRALHSNSLRDLRSSACVAAAAFAAGGGTLAVQYFRKGPDDDESAARKKEEDMKARFEDWANKYNRKYQDEEEKAMRFQVFKETIKWIESQPPSTQEMLLPENCFADLKDKELPSSRSCIDDLDGPDSQEHLVIKFLADNENGEAFVWKPAVKQGDKQTTQVSA